MGRCIMQPKLVAISYMLNRNGYDAKFAQCHNIQQQDLAAYQREDQRCAKEEIMKTPILAIFERVQRMTFPLVAMHKVEKQMNKVCISKEKVKTCGGLMAGKGLGSGSMKEKLVKYACVSAPSAKAESLKKRAMGGDGGLGGGYGSGFGSGIEGGFTDEPSCWTAPMSMCNDPNFARKCGQKCYGGSDNEKLNLRDQQLTSNSKFFVEDKGSTLCGGGYAIMGANKCKEACKALNLPQMQIHGSNLCYKDNEGKCYQDGQERWARNRYGVSLICEKVGLEGGAEGLGGGYGSEFQSGVQGATNSYQQEGESCGMGVVKNHGQCRPDLECVFAPMELIGTCQVKKHKGDCTTFNDEGFDETHGAICKGNTDKVLNDFFDADFQEENLSNCKKFCNCIKECKG